MERNISVEIDKHINNSIFILKAFDLDILSGQVQTTCNSSSNESSYLEAIQQACRSQSLQMLDGYTVDYNGREFGIVKRLSDGEIVTDIIFGFELKTEN